MAKKKQSVPEYGTVTRKGTLYYRTRITDADGKQVSLYATTCEELYEKQLEARRQVEEIIFHRKHPTVAEYCEKWLLMQSAKVSTATIKGYRQNMKNYVINSLGDMYMEEVTADDIRLALVPLSQKSKGLYDTVNMLIKCVFYSAERSQLITDNPCVGNFSKGWKSIEKERCLNRSTGCNSAGYGERASSIFVYYARFVFRSASGRNSCIAMGLCIHR